VASEETPPRESEEVAVARWLVGRFRALGFPKSMAEGLVAEGVDWREAERLLAKNPPGGPAWVYFYLMPNVIDFDA
jgi:hypothetical protein